MKKWSGRARQVPGVMNKTEQAYADYLEAQKQAGEIQSYKYDPLKFRLADRTYYSPDFMVVCNDGVIEFPEVKGHWEDDARVKVKVVAETFPAFRFVAVKVIAKKHGGGWEREEF